MSNFFFHSHSHFSITHQLNRKTPPEQHRLLAGPDSPFGEVEDAEGCDLDLDLGVHLVEVKGHGEVLHLGTQLPHLPGLPGIERGRDPCHRPLHPGRHDGAAAAATLGICLTHHLYCEERTALKKGGAFRE